MSFVVTGVRIPKCAINILLGRSKKLAIDSKACQLWVFRQEVDRKMLRQIGISLLSIGRWLLWWTLCVCLFVCGNQKRTFIGN